MFEQLTPPATATQTSVSMTAPSTLSFPRPTSEAVELFSSPPTSVVLSTTAFVGSVTLAVVGGCEVASGNNASCCVDFIDVLVMGTTEVVVTVIPPVDVGVISVMPEEAWPSGSGAMGFVVGVVGGVAVVMILDFVVGGSLTLVGTSVVVDAV